MLLFTESGLMTYALVMALIMGISIFLDYAQDSQTCKLIWSMLTKLDALRLVFVVSILTWIVNKN